MVNMHEIAKGLEATKSSYESFRGPFVEFLKAGVKMDSGWVATHFFTDIRSRYVWKNMMKMEDEYGNPWVLTVSTDNYDSRAGDPDEAILEVRLSSAVVGERRMFALPPADDLSVEKMNELVEEYKSVLDFVFGGE